MSLTEIVTFLTEMGVLIGFVIPGIAWIKKLIDGQKCQLRSEMLKIYYKNRATEEIHQYEYENFVLMYESYKALKGNSFIDKIYAEVKSWEIVP